MTLTSGLKTSFTSLIYEHDRGGTGTESYQEEEDGGKKAERARERILMRRAEKRGEGKKSIESVMQCQNGPSLTLSLLIPLSSMYEHEKERERKAQITPNTKA